MYLASDVLNSNLAGENRKNSNHNRNEHIETIVSEKAAGKVNSAPPFYYNFSPIIHKSKVQDFFT